MKILLSYNFNELVKAIHKDKRRSGKERSGLCKAELIDGNYQVTDIFFPKQRNNSGYTEFTGEPLDELSMYLFQKEGNLNSYGKYCVWLHSHHTMSAFRSGTDYNTRKGFKDRGSEGFISIVTSKVKGTSECKGIFYHATLDVFTPVAFDLDLQVEVGLPTTVIKEKPTEGYLQFKEGLKNLKRNYNLIQSKYCLTEDQMKSLVSIRSESYSGNKTTTYYTEPAEICLNIEEKIEQLSSVEEVTKTYEYVSPWAKKKEEEKTEKKVNQSKMRNGYDDRDEKYKDLLDK